MAEAWGGLHRDHAALSKLMETRHRFLETWDRGCERRCPGTVLWLRGMNACMMKIGFQKAFQ